MIYKDTIAAIGTALSDSGIGIIRISGEDAFEIADKIFMNKDYRRTFHQYNTHTVHYGYICNYDLANKTSFFEKDNYDDDDIRLIESNIIDEVMIIKMKSPNSYTTEDSVEINCHGGVMMVKAVLNNVLAAGARIAEPGEFTKRAYLNGRIDLSKAEAVIDIIHSKNEFALKNSMKQLKGSLSNKIKEMREQILYEIAFIESALDDPEHISLDGYNDKLYTLTNNLIDQLNHLMMTADNGRILKDGINTVIVGKPNVGKSSLLNLILGEDRAIVTDIAGTTRDVLEESILFSGINLNIMDTAGIRETEDIVEKIGVEKALKYAEDADLILYVVDASSEFDEEDSKILDFVKNRKCIILLNKCDLEQKIDNHFIENMIEDEYKSSIKIVKSSTINNDGIKEFSKCIEDLYDSGFVKMNDQIIITNMRHKENIKNALDSMIQVKNSIELDMPEDFYSIDLMSAYASLGYIIGEEVEDDLVQEIFSKFCMGK